MSAAGASSESNAKRKDAGFGPSVSDIACADRKGTAQWQHARIKTKEMRNRFSCASGVFSALSQCSLCWIALKTHAVWVIAVAPRRFTFVLRHSQCTQYAVRRIPGSILNGFTWICIAIVGFRVQGKNHCTMKPQGRFFALASTATTPWMCLRRRARPQVQRLHAEIEPNHWMYGERPHHEAT